MVHGSLEVLVVNARNLKNTDFLGKTDPFVEIRLDTQRKKTSVKKNAGNNPSFNETFYFDVLNNVNQIYLDVYDEDTVKNDHIGIAVVDLQQTIQTGAFDQMVQLRSPHGTQSAGEIRLVMYFRPKQLPGYTNAPNAVGAGIGAPGYPPGGPGHMHKPNQYPGQQPYGNNPYPQQQNPPACAPDFSQRPPQQNAYPQQYSQGYPQQYPQGYPQQYPPGQQPQYPPGQQYPPGNSQQYTYAPPPMNTQGGPPGGQPYGYPQGQQPPYMATGMQGYPAQQPGGPMPGGATTAFYPGAPGYYPNQQ